MQNILINKSFSKSIERLRNILPFISFSLLIATYLISAVIMGIFHTQNAPNIGFKIAAYLVPLAIQAGRGILVFFFQLNPAQIQNKYSFGLIAATALLVLSMAEAYFVLVPYGVSWIISVSTLMIVGWVIEIMILKETMFVTQLELFQDKDKWQELQSFYQAKKEFDAFIKETASGEAPKAIEAPKSVELSEEESQALELLKELNEHLMGKDNRPSLNGTVKGGK